MKALTRRNNETTVSIFLIELLKRKLSIPFALREGNYLAEHGKSHMSDNEKFISTEILWSFLQSFHYKYHNLS